MEPLDLSAAPPRSPRVKLGGLYMLARTIDKLRAMLPGGKLGEYRIKGFSSQLLDALGIAQDDIQAIVALAKNDDEVVAWVHKHSDPQKYAAINESLAEQTVGQRRNRPDYIERYPLAKDLSPETTQFEVLERDDAQMFGSTSR